MEGTATKVSKEAIEKAEIALGLKKAEESTTVTDAAKQEEIKKAEEAKNALEKEYKDALQKAEEIKAKMEGKEAPKTEEKKETIVKAEEIKPFASDAFEKSINDKFTHLGTLISAKNEEIAELTKKLEKAEEFNQMLGQKVGIIAKQPLDRKSVTTKEFIEKGGDGGEGKGKDEPKRLSLSANRKEVSDMLFEKAISKNADGTEKVTNNSFAKASQFVELGVLTDDQNLTNQVAAFFKKEHNIVLTK